MKPIWINSYPEGVPKEINPNQYESLVDFFEKKCKKFSDLKAVSNMGTSLTFKELEEKSRHFGAYLQEELGLKKGERIAIMLPNSLQYYVAMIGALRAGLIVVNVNPLYTTRELTHQLTDANVETIVVIANFAYTLEESLPQTSIKNIIVTQLGDLLSFPKSHIVNIVVKYFKRMVPSFSLPDIHLFNTVLEEGSHCTLKPILIQNTDTAFLQYTGGTTGIAKGAILTHQNILANLAQLGAWANNSFKEGSEVTISPLPLYHIFSLTVSCFMMIDIGAESVLITNPRDIPGFISEIQSTPFTIIISLNTLCNALLNNENFKKLDFSHLHTCITGGMTTTKDVADRWGKITGVHIMEGYGLTETSPVVAFNSFDEKRFTGGIGYPLPSTEVDVRDEKGNSVPIGEKGELYIKGPQVMQGYWNMPEETKNVLSKDGWFKTGDIVQINEKGLIKVVDRKKDMILVSGFNVYPNEVEDVLSSHPLILEAAVIGVQNKEKTGEMVKAVIVRKDPSLTVMDVIQHCRRDLTPYKIPHLVEFRDELPKTPVGKILRRSLREEEEAKALETMQLQKK